MELMKKKQNHKEIEFKVADENAWEVGLACGGEITIFLEKIIFSSKFNSIIFITYTIFFFDLDNLKIEPWLSFRTIR